MAESFIKHEKPIPYFTSSLLDSYGVRHCFTTRFGGVSEGVFESLNFAKGAGETKDSAENIVQNHAVAAALIGLGPGDICRASQRHTDNIEIVTSEHRGFGLEKPSFAYGVDGFVTKTPGVALSVRFADCVPALLYDVKADIAAAVHSGWRGAEKKIVKNAVEALCSLGEKAKTSSPL